MAKTKVLSVDLLRVDAGTQCRISISDETVEDYAETIEGSEEWPFAPLDVFHDGNDYLVADGFHRTLGAKRAKRSSVPCVVHQGTATDARIFGMTANDRHGLRMSRADKRSCVEWLLDNCKKLTRDEVAEKAGVHIRTVKRIVADRKPASLPSRVTMSPNQRGGESISAKGKPGGVPPTSSEQTPAPSVPVGEPVVRSEEAAEDKPIVGWTSPSEEEPKDYGKCPNCAGTKWIEGEDGATCKKCGQPHGEPAGEVDGDRKRDQRALFIKHVEATMRAVDDLNRLAPAKEHKEAIRLLESLWTIGKEWSL